jgi:hypothetical protein
MAAVRLAASAAIVCALLCMVGVFLPAGQLDTGNRLVSHRTSQSLFQLGKSTDAVRAFVARYQQSTARKLGAKALDKLAPRLPGRLQSRAADVQDLNATLDAIRDEDVELVGKVTAATLWSLLGANLLVIALLFRLRARSSRLRVAAALLASLLTAALAVAVYLVLDRVVLEANREIGRPLFALRAGAYLMPAAAVAGFAAVVVTLIAYVRARSGPAPAGARGWGGAGA